MSLRTFDEADGVSRAFDAGHLGRLTWLGLLVVVIGWALLLATTVLTERLAAKAGLSNAQSFHGDLVEIARCLIGSGFALALIGALQTGFGALNRFFSAVLTRSAPRAAPVQTAPIQATMAPTVDRAAEPLRERRPYQILADGSVEVETIVGTRRFDCMDEARDFI